MAMRLGLGPVFWAEATTSARRWQVYAMRALFVLALLANLTLVWWAEAARKPSLSISDQNHVGVAFFTALVFTELALVMLAAPATAAGSICVERARGVLDQTLVTDLSSAEIVLGKLAGKLLPTLGLVATTLPVMALGGLLGGIDPAALLGLFLVLVGCAVGGCTTAFFFSVFARSTQEALIATYVVGIAWVGAGPCSIGLAQALGSGLLPFVPPAWLWATNPFWLILAPTVQPGSSGLAEDILFLAGALGISAALALLAVWLLRRSGEERGAKKPRGSARDPRSLATRWGPSLDGNPVLWREWRRRQPSRWLRVIVRLYAIGATAISALLIVRLFQGTGKSLEMLSASYNGMQVSLGLLLMSVAPATVLGEERARGSLEILLATPLERRQIVAGLWWGSARPVLGLAALAGALAGAIALTTGALWTIPLVLALVLAQGAALVSLGLALSATFPRPGQAAALNVAALTLATIGWPFAVIMLLSKTRWGAAFVMASPMFGVFLGSAAESQPGLGRIILVMGLGWIVVYACLALILVRATIARLERSGGIGAKGRRGKGADKV